MFQRRTRHSMTRGFAAVAAGLALVLAGCTAAAEPDESTQPRGDTLTVGSYLPDSLNPAKVYGAITMAVCLPYDALLAENSDGSFSPRLATEWGYVDDENKVFELQIREGVTFSDGDELDAEAVADSINYAVESGRTSVLAGMAAEAIDDYTVQVTSESPQPDFEMLFTDFYGAGCIISPTGLANPEVLETESHGVGPYTIESVNPGVEIVFTANDDYYDQSRVLYDRIVVKLYDSDTAATQALLSGQISFWRANIGPTWNQLADENDDLSLYLGSPNFSGVWIFDQQGEVTPALADVRVRQALNYAIDRESIATALFGPDATGRVQPANWNWRGFDEAAEETYPYDPEKARELLAEAGYGDGFTLPVAFFGGSQSDQNLIQALSSNLADVGVTLEGHPAATTADLVPMYSSGTVSGGLQPVDFRSVLQYVTDRHGPEGTNRNALGQVDDELWELLDEASIENTDEAWKGVLDWLTDNAFTLPVVQRALLFIVTDDIDVSDAYVETAGRVDFARITDSE